MGAQDHNQADEPVVEPTERDESLTTNLDKRPSATTAIPVKKWQSIWRKVSMILLGLAILGVLIVVALLMSRTADKVKISNLKSDVRSLNARLESGDKERIALQNKLEGMQAIAAVGRGNDEQQIDAAVRAYSRTFVPDGTNPTIKLSKRDGSQAVVVMNTDDKRYNIYLKKTNELWQPVWAGTGSPSKDVRSMYRITLE